MNPGALVKLLGAATSASPRAAADPRHSEPRPVLHLMADPTISDGFKLLKHCHHLSHGGQGLLLTQVSPIFRVEHPCHRTSSKKRQKPPAAPPCPSLSALPCPRAKSCHPERLQMLAEQEGSFQLNRAIHRGGKILLALINCNFQD